ncbi:hypothetical protein LMG10661_03886 [Ralstonia syzygii subsp. syzygii]|nr:hypothetical protein LMG10661_03886 [Ralstonia syzygii subsp. syzygii]
MPKTEKELITRDASRDIGAELLQAVKQMKAGKAARTTKVALLHKSTLKSKPSL